MGPGSTNGEVPTLPRSAPSNAAELTARRDRSLAGGNVFACLVHEAPDCVADLVANLQHLDPESTVLLYDGSGGALLSELSGLTGPGVLVHPHPRAMAWGKLHDFALDCMRFGLERLDFGALTIVDSDQLALRAGYSAYLAAFLARHPEAGCLVSAEGVQPRTTRIGPPQAAWREFELWAPFLQRFPEGESRFPHWTFWPATVFTRAAAQEFVTLWEDEQLQGILAKSAIWASEEVVLPTLVALLGHEVLRNPCTYDLVQYRTSYSAAQIDAAMARPSVFWVHPVPRSYRDPLRSRLRTHFGSYLPPPSSGAAADPFTSARTRPLPLLLPLLRHMETVEGWLSAAEADLLAAAAVQATGGRAGPHTIIEVGSYCGRGTVVLAGVAAALTPGSVVHAVDPHDRRLGVWGAPPCGVPNAAARLRSHLEAAGLAAVVEHHLSYAAEVALPGPIDLLLIDHLHDYASVAADFSQFQRQLVEGGLVAFHDYGDSFPGVVAFVDQLLATGAYTVVQRVETLVLLRKAGTLALPPLSPVLAATGSGAERDALALLALTAAEALAGAGGSIVEAGRPTAAEDQLLAAVAEGTGRKRANGQPAELPVGLLTLGGERLDGVDPAELFGYQERLAEGARVVLRGCSDDSPAALAALRALLAGGFEQVHRMAGLVVLRASAAPRPLNAAPGHAGAGEPVSTQAGVGPAEGRVWAHALAGHTGEPLVSCIMPTCDRRRFVGRAIRYFLEQDYPNRELVIIDDGTDRVADLIPPDPRIRYVQLLERSTIGAKRNLACEQARGELVVHWDDDDWSAPRRLRYQVEMFHNQDVDVSGLRAVLFCDPGSGQAWRYEYPAGRRPWVHDATFCYRRRFWEGAPFPDTNFGIDTSYLWQGPPKRVGVLADSSFYVALVHAGNTSRKNVHDAWWQPRPVEEIASLMGPEWAAHWAPEPIP
jgi:hypothetical protein